MNNTSEKFTYVLKVATDVLFVKNPVGTSMGVLFGIILHGVLSTIIPFIESLKLLKLNNLTFLHYIAFGIFSFNIKGLIKKNSISKDIENAILFIDQQLKEKRITKLEAKQAYRKLVSTVVDNVSIESMSEIKSHSSR